MAAKQDRHINLPKSFPQDDYTPFGYIDNPYHSAIRNRSGAIRTVPPLGFGFWCRQLPWPYGYGALRQVNYLSFLHLSLQIGDAVLHASEDFDKHNVRLTSRYHTKTLTSYDFEHDGIATSAKYFLDGEHCLTCILELTNTANADQTVLVHATNVYGWPEVRWWGSDGLVSRYNAKDDVGVVKIWAYGDVFLVGADRPSAAYKATTERDQWNEWVYAADLTTCGDGTNTRIRGGKPMYTMMSYEVHVPAGASEAVIIRLTRAVNEEWGLAEHNKTANTTYGNLARQLAGDEEFYANAARLTGDWEPHFRHGFIYDLETLRMTIRPPMGIFKHPWDGMQHFTPRQVLGETMLDTFCLSYAHIELAKDIIYGTFADAPAPNIPCCREDGSMNMISAGGHECGTAPIWGFPYHVIHAIYLRDRDDAWIRALYPHLRAFVEWWLLERTTNKGSFFTACSWESGQDASKRFKLAGEGAGDVADMVRTVDIEAAMAEAMANMATFAEIAGMGADEVAHWRELAEERVIAARQMFVDGWFRDFDDRNDTPIIIDDYYDIMMLTPVTVGVATEEQIEAIRPRFQFFKDNPKFWLEWPSFMFPFAEAAWNIGERRFIASVIIDTGNRIYERTDRRTIQPVGREDTGLPEEYNYRIPGVAREYWPLREEDTGGCENYGWGATLPMHIVRCVIGFREMADLAADRFALAPAFPDEMAGPGKEYGMSNLRYRGTRFDVSYRFKSAGKIEATLSTHADSPITVTVRGEDGGVLAEGASDSHELTLSYGCGNGDLCAVEVGRRR